MQLASGIFQNLLAATLPTVVVITVAVAGFAFALLWELHRRERAYSRRALELIYDGVLAQPSAADGAPYDFDWEARLGAPWADARRSAEHTPPMVQSSPSLA